ncbi:C6 transcription factor [Penicillium taxi]|uniref:C6 transcription factor n=1 Tax=Penicillium taxi TaxID=168475 RepID=UPI002545719F|nr:C6 transcription factor [Penicillium taxi]KAJ5898909.1 C6 transcription factor [Penicillium taxi]
MSTRSLQSQNAKAVLMSSGPVRQRSRQACLPCRRRKRKCDGKFPCNVCQGYDYECEYDNSGQATSQKRSTPSDNHLPPRGKVARVSHQQDIPTLSTSSSKFSDVLEPSKPRHMGKHSAVAFPLYVGLEFQATKLPRLHSFAYHAGIREEPPCAVFFKIVERIQWNTARALIDDYAAIIHPVFGFLDMNHVSTLCEKHWHGQTQNMVFEALICGMMGLASLFKGTLDQETETWLILHAKEILEDSSISRFPCLEQISAWILRVIYVRSTGRPHTAWLCSCNIIHLLEATGLHHVSEFIIQTTGHTVPNPEMSKNVTRLVQVAICLHTFIAFEYGRSVMVFNRQSLESLRSSYGHSDLTMQFCGLIATVPKNQGTEDSSVSIQELSSVLENLTAITVDHDFLTLIRADLALGIYRRLRFMDSNFHQSQNDRVIAVCLAALSAARRLASDTQPWWNIVGTVFQFACALLVMDTPDSFEKLPETMDTLEFIVDCFKTHLAKEALSTARQLVQASLDKKRKGVATLERIIGLDMPDVTVNSPPRNIAALSPPLTSQFPVDLDYLWTMDSNMSI